jgi:hypothetical protein
MDVSDVIRPADMTEAHVLAIANKLKEQTKGRLRAIEPMHGGLTIEVVFQNAVSQLCGGPEHGPYIGGCTTHLAYEPRLEQCYKENTSGTHTPMNPGYGGT